MARHRLQLQRRRTRPDGACGDGTINPGEECDDGNTPAATAARRPARSKSRVRQRHDRRRRRVRRRQHRRRRRLLGDLHDGGPTTAATASIESGRGVRRRQPDTATAARDCRPKSECGDGRSTPARSATTATRRRRRLLVDLHGGSPTCGDGADQRRRGVRRRQHDERRRLLGDLQSEVGMRRRADRRREECDDGNTTTATAARSCQDEAGSRTVSVPGTARPWDQFANSTMVFDGVPTDYDTSTAPISLLL